MGVTENLRRHGFEHQRNMEVEETGMKGKRQFLKVRWMKVKEEECGCRRRRA